MAKKKAGRPASDDPREPFNLRLRRSVINALRENSKTEKRAMNTIAETILEKALV